MKTAKGLGLLAGALSLISGLSLVLNYVWVFIMISVGLWRGVNWPFAAPLWLFILNMIIYVPLSIWMILDKRRDVFLFAAFWAILSSALNFVSMSYVSPSFVFLSFLIVFSSTYYYVTKTKPTAPSYMSSLAGILALAQGGYLVFVFSLITWMSFGGRNPVSGIPLTRLYLTPFMISVEISMVVYLILGFGIVWGKEKLLFYLALWTIIEAALATLPFWLETGIDLLSIIILFLSTYCYWTRQKI